MEKETSTEVLEERIKGIHATLMAEFEVLHTNIRYIKEQTTKTNRSVADVIKRLSEVEKIQAQCPREDYFQYKKDNEIIHFFIKHPKIFGYTILGLAFLAVINLILYLI